MRKTALLSEWSRTQDNRFDKVRKPSSQWADVAKFWTHLSAGNITHAMLIADRFRLYHHCRSILCWLHSPLSICWQITAAEDWVQLAGIGFENRHRSWFPWWIFLWFSQPLETSIGVVLNSFLPQVCEFIVHKTPYHRRYMTPAVEEASLNTHDGGRKLLSDNIRRRIDQKLRTRFVTLVVFMFVKQPVAGTGCLWGYSRLFSSSSHADTNFAAIARVSRPSCRWTWEGQFLH